MTRPAISVVIPTWQGLRYLPACLSALSAQLTPDDEIVLVDNHSRDGAGAWARRYMPEVRVLALPVGPATTVKRSALGAISSCSMTWPRQLL